MSYGYNTRPPTSWTQSAQPESSGVDARSENKSEAGARSGSDISWILPLRATMPPSSDSTWSNSHSTKNGWGVGGAKSYPRAFETTKKQTILFFKPFCFSNHFFFNNTEQNKTNPQKQTINKRQTNKSDPSTKQTNTKTIRQTDKRDPSSCVLRVKNYLPLANTGSCLPRVESPMPLSAGQRGVV